MKPLVFDNAFVRELPADPQPENRCRQVHRACYTLVQPTPMPAPELIAWSPEMAGLLDLSREDIESPEFVEVFAGNRLMEGMVTYAACYGGHQFGHWAGQLGDGRAINLGEVVNRAGQRWELQLKGAGQTPYSRSADGRAVLRSSLREFLCSEAMHHLGIPTTRALCLIGTGEQVVRDMLYDGHPRPEPGAIVCRVSPSFIRFGNFEIFASREDHETLAQLIDFTIRRDFPELQGPNRRADWFAEVCERTARLMVDWQRVGFVHGVMNTDNLSILGLTIDYGPYGWVDNFDFDWTPNTTDAEHRRYCFGRQPAIAHWNLAQLANALLPVFGDPAPLQAGIDRFVAEFETGYPRMLADKLGLRDWRKDDDGKLAETLHALMQRAEIDMSLFFRGLAEVRSDSPDLAPLEPTFYSEDKRRQHRPELVDWLHRYTARIREEGMPDSARRERMNAVNPLYVPRNYLAQEAIDSAEQGDYRPLHELMDVLRRPYQEQPGREHYAGKRPDWARHRPGCSMLSCSS